jgi:CheY-like chemotaxis protein
VLDLAMPDVNGFEVARALQDPSRANKPMLVAVSGFGEPADKERCAEAGFDLHLTKPVDFAVFEELLSLLQETARLAKQSHYLAFAQAVASKTLLSAQVEMTAIFLKLAQTTGVPETRQRCLHKARRARDVVARQLNKEPRMVALSPLDFVLNDALDKALASLGAAMGDIQLLNSQGFLEIMVQRGFGPEFVRDFQKPGAADALAGATAMLDQATVVVEDVEASERFAPHRAMARRAGFRAFGSTPLIDPDGRALGVLDVHFAQPHSWQGWELVALAHCAGQAAALIRWATD